MQPQTSRLLQVSQIFSVFFPIFIEIKSFLNQENNQKEIKSHLYYCPAYHQTLNRQ